MKIKRNNSNGDGCTGDSDTELSDSNFKTFNRRDFLKAQSWFFKKLGNFDKSWVKLIKNKESEWKGIYHCKAYRYFYFLTDNLKIIISLKDIINSIFPNIQI